MSGSLVHSPADLLRRLLISLGLGSDPAPTPGAWPVYTGNMPSTPDACMATFDTAGRVSARVHPGSERLEHHGWQVRVRAATRPASWARARAVAVALDEDVFVETVTVDGTTYCVQSVQRTTDALFLGTEETSSRVIHVVNGLICVRLYG